MLPVSPPHLLSCIFKIIWYLPDCYLRNFTSNAISKCITNRQQLTGIIDISNLTLICPKDISTIQGDKATNKTHLLSTFSLKQYIKCHSLTIIFFQDSDQIIRVQTVFNHWLIFSKVSHQMFLECLKTLVHSANGLSISQMPD